MIKVSVKGFDDIRRFLAELPKEIKRVAEKAVGEFLIGDERHGLKHYPPYRHVPFEDGAGWSTDPEKKRRQQRWLFAAIRDGRVTPGMSASNGYMRDAWSYKQRGNVWYIENDVKHTKWLVGTGEPNTQTVHAQRQGWREIPKIVQDNLKGAFRHAIAEVKKFIASKRRH